MHVYDWRPGDSAPSSSARFIFVFASAPFNQTSYRLFINKLHKQTGSSGTASSQLQLLCWDELAVVISIDMKVESIVSGVDWEKLISGIPKVPQI